MRAHWQLLHEHFLRALNSQSIRKDFAMVKQARPALRHFTDQYSVLDFLHAREGDADEKNSILEALVNEAQSAGNVSKCAITLLWVGLWPGLDSVYHRLGRHFGQSPDELVSAISEQFTKAVHRADLSRIKRLAATLLCNIERDARLSLRRERAGPLDSYDLTLFYYGGAYSQFACGLPAAANPDDQMEKIRELLGGYVGVDADLVVAVLITGEGQYEAAKRIGISYDALRKRYQRSINRLRIKVGKIRKDVVPFRQKNARFDFEYTASADLRYEELV
jgi:hypothetical protein